MLLFNKKYFIFLKNVHKASKKKNILLLMKAIKCLYGPKKKLYFNLIFKLGGNIYLLLIYVKQF